MNKDKEAQRMVNRDSIIEKNSKSEIYQRNSNKNLAEVKQDTTSSSNTNTNTNTSHNNTSTTSTNNLPNKSDNKTQQTTQPSQKGPSVNVKMEFDPKTGQVIGVKPDVKMSAQDAKNIYDNNKETIHAGAAASAKFAKNVAENQKNDPLTTSGGGKSNAFANLFGMGGKKP